MTQKRKKIIDTAPGRYSLLKYAKA